MEREECIRSRKAEGSKQKPRRSGQGITVPLMSCRGFRDLNRSHFDNNLFSAGCKELQTWTVRNIVYKPAVLPDLQFVHAYTQQLSAQISGEANFVCFEYLPVKMYGLQKSTRADTEFHFSIQTVSYSRNRTANSKLREPWAISREDRLRFRDRQTLAWMLARN